MVGEGTTAITITFLLAMAGYAGLTTVLLLSLRVRLPTFLWRGVACVILAHVIMVWAFRYHGDVSLALRNGPAGFLMFHGALAMVLISLFTSERLSKVLIRLSFVIVTMGAIGATFLYDVVAVYRIPVLTCALAGIGGLMWAFIQRRRTAAA